MFPVAAFPTIHTMSGQSVGGLLRNLGRNASSWPSANLAIYVPFYVAEALRVRSLSAPCESSSGNGDVGIYAYDGTRIVSSGSFAFSGFDMNTRNITDTELQPGIYYLALVCDNATNAALRFTPGVQNIRMAGICQEASAFPLPSTATFATATNDYAPFISAFVGMDT